jgi:1-phosphatidylinositol-4-phosphate 5-kinase
MQSMSFGSSKESIAAELKSNFYAEEGKTSRHKFISDDGKHIYHIGIIDYLQDFNIDKKGENLLKQYLMQAGSGISAVPPPQYAQRFLRFMKDSVIIN